MEVGKILQGHQRRLPRGAGGRGALGAPLGAVLGPFIVSNNNDNHNHNHNNDHRHITTNIISVSSIIITTSIIRIISTIRIIRIISIISIISIMSIMSIFTSVITIIDISTTTIIVIIIIIIIFVFIVIIIIIIVIIMYDCICRRPRRGWPRGARAVRLLVVRCVNPRGDLNGVWKEKYSVRGRLFVWWSGGITSLTLLI